MRFRRFLGLVAILVANKLDVFGLAGSENTIIPRVPHLFILYGKYMPLHTISLAFGDKGHPFFPFECPYPLTPGTWTYLILVTFSISQDLWTNSLKAELARIGSTNLSGGWSFSPHLRAHEMRGPAFLGTRPPLSGSGPFPRSENWDEVCSAELDDPARPGPRSEFSEAVV